MAEGHIFSRVPPWFNIPSRGVNRPQDEGPLQCLLPNLTLEKGVLPNLLAFFNIFLMYYV